MGIRLVLGQDHDGTKRAEILMACDSCKIHSSQSPLAWYWSEESGKIKESKFLCQDCFRKYPNLDKTGITDFLLVKGFSDYFTAAHVR